MDSNIAVVGLQWGDEGKARVIDFLTEKSDYVVRFQGGSNAGHTVVANGKKYIFHLIPSGMLHPGVRCLIGPGVVLDPWSLKQEVEELQGDISDITSRISISPGCHLVLPYHRELDLVYESLKGAGKLGTTGRGIGPCYSDKALRHGIKLNALAHPKYLKDRISMILPIQNAFLTKIGGKDPIDENQLYDQLMEIGEWVNPMVGDVPDIINREIRAGKHFLFEGAQSVLLDIDYGTYPYVTSSNSSLTGLYAGCGVHPKHVEEVWGVSKAYCTRVGEGPFPTELLGDEGDALREAGGEYGATTGRPRRCGWLDLPALKYAIETSGITALALTKLDVLTGYDKIKVCTAYKGDSHRIYHTDPIASTSLEPEYWEAPGWQEDLSSCTKLDELPAAARDYVDYIQGQVGIPIKLIGIGASREQTILL